MWLIPWLIKECQTWWILITWIMKQTWMINRLQFNNQPTTFISFSTSNLTRPMRTQLAMLSFHTIKYRSFILCLLTYINTYNVLWKKLHSLTNAFLVLQWIILKIYICLYYPMSYIQINITYIEHAV